MVAGFASAIWFALTGGALGFGLGGVVGALVVGGIAGGVGAVFGWAVVKAEPYEKTAASVLIFLIDHTWSLLNTMAGAIYLTANLIFGNKIDLERSRHSGAIQLENGVIPGYLTTVGTVIAGVDEPVHAHEHGHVLQARIFGPMYLLLVAISYVLATVLPYWLLYHDRTKYPINSFGNYFLQGVYPHTWNEEWCYRVYGPAR
ncbi:MAG TPA: glycine zipper family protein [Micromonosporaceae bacterium]|nr:glycine zipper family protein [Micromonosporaceae bacterium]